MYIFSNQPFLHRYLLWMFTCLLFSFSLFAQPSDSLTKAIQQWDGQRIAELKAENGWLNLAGLEWLKPGMNSIGSGKDANIHFPAGKFPLSAGSLIWENNEVWYAPDAAVTMQDNGVPIKEKKLLWSEKGTNDTKLSYATIRWTIIKRDTKIGVRIRDLSSPAIQDFKGIDRFPARPDWVIQARFVPEPSWSFRTIPIVNVLGQTIQMKTLGKFLVNIGGQAYQLDAIEDGPGIPLIVFGDPTNDVTTYGSGRFLSPPMPAEGVTDVWLDFNKAYNPPCAFTSFATCPLPPPQNQLQLPVEAGEKLYKKQPK